MTDGAYGGHHIDVTSGLGYAGSVVTVTAATAALDGELGLVDGRVSGVGGRPRSICGHEYRPPTWDV